MKTLNQLRPRSSGLQSLLGALASLSLAYAGAAAGCAGDGTVDVPGAAGGASSLGTGGAGACVPTEELCDGLDNSCEGHVDEGCACIEGDTQSCFSGAPELLAVGACKGGEQACDQHGAWGDCVGEVVPGAEECNALDDDCDMETDEGFGAVTCGLGICKVTVDECTEGTFHPCIPGAPNPEGESCDGFDDDCDGEVDEGCSCINGEVQSCYTGAPATQSVGACKDGSQSCVLGQWNACSGDVTPSAEGCNGVDDDCDGNTDEGDPDGGAACGTGKLGVCAAGVEHCEAGKLACTQSTQPSADLCDGKDNNCDGATDENNPGGGGTCDTGLLGSCKPGVFECKGGKVVCTQTVFAKVEKCNGADDDCDGTNDDGNPDAGGACLTGQLGICAPGVEACTGGKLVCQQTSMMAAETCNAKDDDCDGTNDDGNPGGGQTCDTGKLGVCKPGTTNCTNGNIACDQNAQAQAETCNAKDDDCDGTNDDGNPGGNVACNTGNLGICAVGTTACMNGSLACNQNAKAVAETCNGKDDDCDGANDDGNPGGNVACNTGKLGICAPGTSACTNGNVLCNQNSQAANELCNGKDDDCDGTNDDGNPGGGAACNTGLKGACAPGQTECKNGGLACNQVIFASNEQPSKCQDGIDNDCDGTADAADTASCCPHSKCTTGAPLTPGCDTCVAAICVADPFCCTMDWDDLCVGHVVDSVICNSAACGNKCPHGGCVTGAPMFLGCNHDLGSTCVNKVCQADPFCCQNFWDAACVSQKNTLCGQTCN
ncbi:MAG: hypothetical protein EXR75_13735 [Myxococcales bacterium]|nr:hypothetical protein [Myxococcales bacterium]